MPSATLTARRDAGGGLSLISLDVDAELAAEYDVPGKYVEIRTPNGNGFFVLAGALGRRPWELLIRQVGAAAELLVTSPVGSRFDVSAPLGSGFPVGDALGKTLAVAVVGGALATARPLVSCRMVAGEAAKTFVYIGTRAAADVPLADEVEAWVAAGVTVVLCLSREELEQHREILPRARREEGYVQSIVQKDLAAGELDGAIVFAAGSEQMLADMRELGDGPGARLVVVTNV